MFLSYVFGESRQVWPQDAAQQTITVFAAASVTNAVNEIKAAFTKKTGVAVQTSYASSAALAQQIVHGAEADVFISADEKWAEHLAKKDLVAQRRNVLGNRMVVVVPADSSRTVKEPMDLLDAMIEHLAIGEPNSVPAGKYAKQALVKLGLWDRLKDRAVAGQDVRHALTFVETGAAEAGIVYATDAAVSKKVKIAIELSENLTDPIRYPIVLLKHGQGRPAAESFYRWLISPEGLKVFRSYGFVILPQPDGL